MAAPWFDSDAQGRVGVFLTFSYFHKLLGKERNFSKFYGVQKRHTAAARSVISILTCSGGSKSTSSSSFSSSAWFGWYNTTVGCVGSEEANDALLVVLVERLWVRWVGRWTKSLWFEEERRGWNRWRGRASRFRCNIWDRLANQSVRGCRRRTHPRTAERTRFAPWEEKMCTRRTSQTHQPFSVPPMCILKIHLEFCNLVLSYIFYKLLPTEVFVRKNCCLSYIKRVVTWVTGLYCPSLPPEDN